MIGPRVRMVLGDLWLNWERAMLVVGAISVGVFSVGSLLVGYTILAREINASYMTSLPASARIWTPGIDESLLGMVERRPDIAVAESRQTITASLLAGENDWQAMLLTVPSDFARMRADTFRRDSGAWPPAPGEILIERSSMIVAKTKVGSEITVKMPNGVQRRLRVAGTVHNASVTPGWMAHLVYGYVAPETLSQFGMARSADELKVTLKERTADEASVGRSASALRTWLEARGHRVSRVEVPKPGEHPNMSAMLLILNMMLTFAALSLLLSGLLVFNLVSGIVARQRRQIGVMKAVGATTAQVMGVYLGMVAGLGIVASVVAMPLAWVAGQGFASLVLSVFNLDLARSDVPAWVFVVQITVGVVVPVLAAAYPAYRGSVSTVLESLRDAGPAAAAGEDSAAAATGRRTVLGRPLILSVRNAFRSKGRLALTLVALSLGGAVFMAAIDVNASLTGTIDKSYDRRKYDVDIQLTRPYSKTAVESAVRDSDGVAAAEAWLQVPSSVVRPNGTLGNELYLTGLNPGSPLLDSPVSAGRRLQPRDTRMLVVTPTLADKEPALRVGSRVTLRVDGRDTSWLVVGAVREVGSGMTAYAPYGQVARAARLQGMANDVRVVARNSRPAAVAAARDSAEKRLDRAGLGVSSAQTVASSRQVLINHVAITLTFLLLVSVLASVVGAMGLASTMSINVIERTREIGVLRAIGATTHAILRIIVLEGVLISLASWLIAVPLSIPLSHATSAVPAAVFIRAPLDNAVSAFGIWLWLAIVVAVGFGASFTPAWRAARAPVPDTLAYE